jgi:hypothetical protein
MHECREGDVTHPEDLSLQEAADHFGLSTPTIRRRIAADEFRGERQNTTQGPAFGSISSQRPTTR